MSNVVLSKTKYQELKRRADFFERIVRIAEEELFSPPPTRSRSEVFSGFRATGKYNAAFLKSLESGLDDSDYFNQR